MVRNEVPIMDRPVSVIAVANEKGGVGKTVTVINLGAAFVINGKRVLLIDMDPQANTTKGLGIDTAEIKLSTYDIIKTGRSLPLADTIISTRWQGLDLMPSHIDLSGAEIELVDEVGRENRLKQALKNLPMVYDYIFIDTPPSLSLLTVNVFAYADSILVPCQTHPYSYDALSELFDTIDMIKKAINPKLKVSAIVATFFDQRTRVSHQVLEKLKRDTRYGPILCDTVIRINTTIAESAAAGQPVVFFRNSSYGASDYIRLAEEIQTRF